jgi:Ca2+/Na+ antiporter
MKKNTHNFTLKEQLTIWSAILLIIFLVSYVLIIDFAINISSSDKKNNETIEKNKNKNEKSKYEINDEYLANQEEYEIIYYDDAQMNGDLKINDHLVNFKTTSVLRHIVNVYKLEDIYIVIVDELFDKNLDYFDHVIYAIDKEGNIIWYQKPEEYCKKDKTDNCIGTIGYHFTTLFGYDGSPYVIKDKKISFVTEVSIKDPVNTASKMNDDDIFAVEYEIEYLGDNKFSELKVLKSITAKEYLEKYSESDHKSLCHKN